MFKYLLGRQLMRHMVDTQQIDITTFGSIPGRDAKEAMKLLDMVMTNHRLMSRTLVTVFNDAAGCFDRIRPNMADLAMRRVGCPKSITNTHSIAQLGMTHRVKTAMGISPGSIKWDSTMLRCVTIAGILHLLGNIGGIGQGGGGSPVGWLVVLLIMIKAYRHFSPGATVTDPYGDSSCNLHVVSYVDDNSLLRSFDPTETASSIVNTVSTELTSWWKLLRVTGGDLALEKCTYSIMKWKWKGYYNDRTLDIINSDVDKVIVVDQAGGHISIRHLHPEKAERQLGIRLSMQGNWNDELQHRTTQVKNLCERLYCAHLSHYEAFMAYQFYIQSALYYALPLTVFSFDECVSLNKIILNKVLPKCGINRHTPRAVVFAPKAIGGLEFDHVWTKQFTLHLEMIQMHLRRRDTLGQTYLCNLNCMQLLVGKSTCFLALEPTQHRYVDQSGGLGMLWLACYTLEIQLIVPSMMIPGTKDNNDRLLMDVATEDPLLRLNNRKLVAINSCRLFHGVTSIGDMYYYTGTRLNLGFLSPQGGRQIKKHLLKNWPFQPEPTSWQWQIWKEFIYRNFLTGHREVVPLEPGCGSCVHPLVNMIAHLKSHAASRFSSLDESVQALHPDLRYYIANLHYPAGSDESLCQAMQQGNLVGSTDGSAHEC